VSEVVRLAVIGGSGTSTPELIDAVADWPGGADRRPALEIVLQGRSAEKLALVAEACRSRLPVADGNVTVSTETSLQRALEGAAVALIQVRIGGLDARIYDETFPRASGIPGEETMGPGGFANAMRTVTALAGLWDALSAWASEAFIINLTNPSGIVAQAATAHTGLRIVSVCDGPVTFVEGVAKATGRDVRSVRLAYAGMNHAGFWGDPDTEALLAAMSATRGIEPDDVRALGALPSPYLRFYLHPDKELAAQLALAESRAQVLKRLEAELLDQYSSGIEASEHKRRGALWYAVSIVPLIDAFAYGSSEPTVLGLPNEGTVDWAPRDAFVELPTDVLAGGELRRHPAVALPQAATTMLERHATFETSTARALAGCRSREDVRARRDRLVEALATNPMVPSSSLAERLLDEILDTSPTWALVPDIL
jgi:6-phospho-beta-glucosidase